MAEIENINFSEYNAPPYLAQQFKDTEVQKLAALPDRQFQELADTAHAMLSGMWIDNGRGVQLDIIGKHVDLQRYGLTDSNYRTSLKLKAKINNAGGLINSIIEAVRVIFQTSEMHVIEVPPAKILILLSEDSLVNRTILSDFELDTGETLTLSTGDIFQVEQPDELPETILYDLLPAGVGLKFAKPEPFLVSADGVTEEPLTINGEDMRIISVVW